jgi:hypothetical protein
MQREHLPTRETNFRLAQDQSSVATGIRSRRIHRRQRKPKAVRGYLHDYIEATGIADDVDGYLFRSARRKTGQLTANPLFQQDAHRIIRRRAKAAGIETRIGKHTFRATGDYGVSEEQRQVGSRTADRQP